MILYFQRVNGNIILSYLKKILYWLQVYQVCCWNTIMKHHARTSSLSSICVTVEVLTIGSSIPSIKTQFPAGILFTSMLYLKRNNLNTWKTTCVIYRPYFIVLFRTQQTLLQRSTNDQSNVKVKERFLLPRDASVIALVK